MGGPHPFKEQDIELMHLIQADVLHQAVGAAIKDGDLLTDWHRRVLRLDQLLIVLAALVQNHFRHSVHIR